MLILLKVYKLIIPAQKLKFSIKDFFSKCDQIRRKLWIWSHLLKKSLLENFIFCVACVKQHRMRDDDETVIPHAGHVSKHNKKQKVYEVNV